MSETETETTNPDAEPDEQIDGDDDSGDGDEDESQTSAAAAAADGSAELLKKADAENRRYHTRLAKILGPDDNRRECATCNGLGVTWGAPETEVELVHPENLTTCEACAGYGLVLTGSRNPDHATAICTSCAGNGFITQVAPLAPVAPYVPAQQVAEAPIGGQWVPGRGFVPYGSTDPLPNTAGLA